MLDLAGGDEEHLCHMEKTKGWAHLTTNELKDRNRNSH